MRADLTRHVCRIASDKQTYRVKSRFDALREINTETKDQQKSSHILHGESLVRFLPYLPSEFPFKASSTESLICRKAES